MTRTEKKTLLMQLIYANAASASGFLVADAKPMAAEKSAARACRQAADAGTLFKVRVSQSAAFAYFSTQVLANAYQRKHQKDVLANAATTITFAPKPAKVAKPSQSAEPFYPAHVKTRVYPTPAPRNQAVPLPAFIHNGYGSMR